MGMPIRTGSLSKELLAEDPALVALLLEDYQVAKRREHCSRADFAAGWLALARRMKLGQRRNGSRKNGKIEVKTLEKVA
jgi:hypothetical protein